MPKRTLSSREHKTLGSVTTFRTDLGDLFERTRQQPRQNSESTSLVDELNATKLALEASTRELQEKGEILRGLQNTLDEINPILSEYESSLSDKDRKLKKQRQEYDRAREEWRQSLDLMLSAQQQSEGLYEQQIEDLKEEITALAVKSAPPTEPSSQTIELQSRIDEISAENARLKQQLEQSATSNGPVSGAEADSEYVEQLEKKVERLSQDVTSMEIVLEQSQRNNKAKDLRIAELEIELDELKEDHVDSVQKGLETLSVEDWKVQEEQFKKRIAELEQQVADHSEKENLPPMETAGPKHTELLDKIANLEAELHSNKGLVDSQSKKIEDLQQNINKSLELESQLQKQVESLDQDANKDLVKTIEDLKHELAMRPSFEELTELQTSLEEIERLHRNDLYLKDQELKSLSEEYKTIAEEKQGLLEKMESLKAEKVLQTPLNTSPIKKGSSTGSASLPDPETWAKTDSLPIYMPKAPVDPSSGRSDWCGLCERDGHDSLNCPYENDMF